MSVLVGVFVALKAVAYYLDRYGLLFGYGDVSKQPAQQDPAPTDVFHRTCSRPACEQSLPADGRHGHREAPPLLAFAPGSRPETARNSIPRQKAKPEDLTAAFRAAGTTRPALPPCPYR